MAEASSPIHENTGFMAYNTLAGGVLTGKYLDVPAAWDDFQTNQERARQSLSKPRGRHDEPGTSGYIKSPDGSMLNTGSLISLKLPQAGVERSTDTEPGLLIVQPASMPRLPRSMACP